MKIILIVLSILCFNSLLAAPSFNRFCYDASNELDGIFLVRTLDDENFILSQGSKESFFDEYEERFFEGLNYDSVVYTEKSRTITGLLMGEARTTIIFSEDYLSSEVSTAGNDYNFTCKAYEGLEFESVN